MGSNPKSTKGEYFRNNIWWWGPLWDYCKTVAPVICKPCDGEYNNGDGLDHVRAAALSDLLRKEIETGRCSLWEKEFEEYILSIPKIPCTYCETTGVRTDKVGVEEGMPERILEEDQALKLGRTTGWCNGCDGEGERSDSLSWYRFDVKNVENFADFLEACGGFRIW